MKNSYFRKELQGFIPYTPGEQPAAESRIIKLNTNENPYPPSPKIDAALLTILQNGYLRKYPDFYARKLQLELAKRHSLKPENFLVTNGSDEGLRLLFFSGLGQNSTVVLPYPTYSHYPVLVNMTMTGSKIKEVPVKENLGFDFAALAREQGELLAFAHPNAPTGIMEDKNRLLELAGKFNGLVLSDEAYIDFAGEENSLIDQIGKIPNLVVARTFSKSYSLAGLRVGYLVADESVIAVLNKLKDSYNLNMLSQAAALEAYLDREYFSKNLRLVIAQREFLAQQLTRLDFAVVESKTNFIFAKPPAGFNAETVYNHLKQKNIYIRYFSGKIVSDYIRITIGSEEENSLLLVEIKSLVKK